MASTIPTTEAEKNVARTQIVIGLLDSNDKVLAEVISWILDEREAVLDRAFTERAAKLGIPR
jgi:hypothetical protein